MPPAISDDEASDASMDAPIVKRDRKSLSYSEPAENGDVSEDELEEKEVNGDVQEDDNEDEEDDDDDEGDVYEVEKIMSHMIADDGTPRFEVKWLGYEKKADRTWEPEGNFEGTAQAALSDYLAGIGGRENLFDETKSALNTKKRGRQSTGNGAGASKRARKSGHPADDEPPRSKEANEFKPPAGSWEDHVDSVDMFRNDDGSLSVLLNWKNGHKTQHPTKQAYTRCPQKILQFYESKINFKTD